MNICIYNIMSFIKLGNLCLTEKSFLEHFGCCVKSLEGNCII